MYCCIYLSFQTHINWRIAILTEHPRYSIHCQIYWMSCFVFLKHRDSLNPLSNCHVVHVKDRSLSRNINIIRFLKISIRSLFDQYPHNYSNGRHLSCLDCNIHPPFLIKATCNWTNITHHYLHSIWQRRNCECSAPKMAAAIIMAHVMAKVICKNLLACNKWLDSSNLELSKAHALAISALSLNTKKILAMPL